MVVPKIIRNVFQYVRDNVTRNVCNYGSAEKQKDLPVKCELVRSEKKLAGIDGSLVIQRTLRERTTQVGFNPSEADRSHTK